MPEAVIVSTARSQIRRAYKGSLKDMRPDDLAAQMVTAALDKVPALDRIHIDDLMLGCGQPAGELGFNMGRVVALLAGMDNLPGVTDIFLYVSGDAFDLATRVQEYRHVKAFRVTYIREP